MHESILIYRNMRYLKVALVVVAVAALAYVIDRPLGPPNGATWLGYTLGVASAAVMIWLAWFGIQKRRYGIGKRPLQEWLSAHVYLGGALFVLMTLHAGFRLGPNIHSVLYVITLIVIMSGLVGVYCYVRYPRLLTENRRGLSSEVMLAQIAELDREIRVNAMAMDDETNALVLTAAHDTVVGGSLYQQLRGFDPGCPTTIARTHVESVIEVSDDTTSRQLLTRLMRKEDLLKRIRRDVQLRGLLRIWLYVHVPFSVAALAALVTHVVTVFYYW